MKYIFSEKIRRFAHKHSRSKKGTTLIELVATIAILGIVSSISLSALYAMADIATRGQNISVAQRTSALLSEQFSLYGNTSSNVETYNDLPNASDTSNGFVNVDNGLGDYNDYFVSASKTADNTIIFSKFNANTKTYDTITVIDNVKSISFSTKKLNGLDKYLLEYTITAINAKKDSEGNVGKEYVLKGGVVMNNTSSSYSPPDVDNFVVSTDKVNDAANYKNVFRIRSTSRKGIDRD